MNEKCVSLTTRECECKNGFSPNVFGDCVDVDECVFSSYFCPNRSKCVNKKGSYVCLTTTASTLATTSTTTVKNENTTVLVLNNYPKNNEPAMDLRKLNFRILIYQRFH